jgi:hypothetical protein
MTACSLPSTHLRPRISVSVYINDGYRLQDYSGDGPEYCSGVATPVNEPREVAAAFADSIRTVARRIR